jgi:hypothetical protein
MAYRLVYTRIIDKAYETEEQFKLDLFNAFEVVDHPRAERVYELAYEYGHASGYTEILYYFSDIVSLIK